MNERLAPYAGMEFSARPVVILSAAIRVALEDGWRAMKRDRVAEVAGVGQGSVNTHFGTIEGLRDAVMDEAVRLATTGDETVLPILAQGLTEQHPAARAAPVEVKRRALDLML